MLKSTKLVRDYFRCEANHKYWEVLNYIFSYVTCIFLYVKTYFDVLRSCKTVEATESPFDRSTFSLNKCSGPL